MTLVEKILSKIFKHVDIIKKKDGVDTVYLRRWFVGKIGSKQIYIHKIFQSDDDPDPHDHPWDFTTLVLWNGYDDEHRVFQKTFHKEFGGTVFKVENVPVTFVDTLKFLSFRKRPAEHIHRVQKFDDRPTWTFVVRGPYRREWGFWKGTKWILWREYLNFWEKDPYDPEAREP